MVIILWDRELTGSRDNFLPKSQLGISAMTGFLFLALAGNGFFRPVSPDMGHFIPRFRAMKADFDTIAESVNPLC